ncbi:MAG: glycyl-radical enzyme activating protein [Oscillospiraceae bacterium]|nr:glycyl-radical enzyme activating protein [Oscillospiraceae bacterium]
MPEPTGIIFDIDHFGVHDGPGIRCVVYFKGCPLRCLWCHSPESREFGAQRVFIASKCLSCAECEGDGCPHGASQLCGREVALSELAAEILADKVFFAASGGGVTLSGGEVLAQPNFAAALLKRLRDEGIHTVVETCVMTAPDFLKEISPLVDIFYCDVKIMDSDRHRLYTGAGNEAILENIALLAKLREGRGVVLRVPLIPGYTDAPEDVAEVYRFAAQTGIREVHLLPYNTSAPAKYQWLSLPYPLGLLERQSASDLEGLALSAPTGIKVTII